MPAACAPCAARVALRAPGFAGSALAPPGREAAAARGSSGKKIQEQEHAQDHRSGLHGRRRHRRGQLYLAGIISTGFHRERGKHRPARSTPSGAAVIDGASIGHAVLTLGGHLQTGHGSTGPRYPAHRSHRLNRPSPETKERS